MLGVCSLSVSVWVFTDPACVGVEEAELLAKATGVCETVRARAVDLEVCEQSTERALRGLQGRSDAKGLGVGRTEDLTPVDCVFLRREAERVRRCSRHNILGCVSLSLDKCTACVHPDIRIKSHIVRVVSYVLDTS